MSDLTPEQLKQVSRLATQELARRELARRNMLEFIKLSYSTPGNPYLAGWIHREICELLDAFIEACEQNLSPRLMIFLPPRSGKSLIVSEHFPPYVLGKHPEWEVVAATYGQDLANVFGRKVRNLLNNTIYQDLFPQIKISKDSNAVDSVATTSRGGYVAVGVGGALTGRGAKILIIDDPVKDREAADSETQREATYDWYSSVARTRLAPGGGIIVLQTRWHEDDLSGKLLAHAKENPDADQWKVYEFPAIATQDEKHRKAGEALHPERFDLKALRQLRATLRPRDWTALYQANPIPDDGNFFHRDWIKQRPPPENTPLYWYIATDFAVGTKETNDYSVLLPFAVDPKGDIYFAEPIRARVDPHVLIEQLLDLIEKYQPMRVAIEKGVISKSIGPFLNARMRERGIYCTFFDQTPSKDKQTRARSLQGRMQQGKVFFPDCPIFNESLLSEMLAFPAGKHDDFVDAASWAALMLDALIEPAPTADIPLPEIETDTWEDLQRRQRKTAATDRHRPTSLFAHLPKPEKKPKPIRW